MPSVKLLARSQVQAYDPARDSSFSSYKETTMRMPRGPNCSPDRASIRRVAIDILKTSNVTVERVTDALYTTFKLQLPQGEFFLLRSRPGFNIRLLRGEAHRLAVEAGVLGLLQQHEHVSAPRLLDYHTTTISIGSFYTISGPFIGPVLSTLGQALGLQTRADVDRSLGRYVRRLSSVTSPVFGTINQLPVSTSWAKAYALLLESVLRDAEDSLISLPYDNMRDQVRKHKGSLEKITQPRLVVMEVALAENIVVNPSTLQVTSLLDYSTAIWGDPFICDCFYRPSQGFLEGFGDTLSGDNEKRIRHLLYIVYHSLLAIVRQSYRPQADSHELEARRQLTTALRYLSAIASIA